MQAILFYISLPLLYFISILPYSILYLISDFVFFILFRVIGYRRTVVQQNLKNSFPEKSAKELQEIEKKFYHFFCDLGVETVKSLTITEKTLRKRVQFKGIEVIEEYYKKNKSIILALGHYGNWEIGGIRYSLESFHQQFAIFHRIENKHVNKLIYNMRSRFGCRLYSMQESVRGIINNRDLLTATMFIGDQTPSPKTAYWMQFLNQDTPVFTGTGKISKKMKFPVVFLSIKRLRRGYYEMTAEHLIKNPDDYTEAQILEIFTKRLEKDINECPEIWLWSHRRWKHKRELP